MGKKNPNHIKSVVNSPSPYCSPDFIANLWQSKLLYLFLETFLCYLWSQACMWHCIRTLLAIAQHPFQKGLNSIFNIWLICLFYRYVKVAPVPLALMVRNLSPASRVSFAFSHSLQLLPLLTSSSWCSYMDFELSSYKAEQNQPLLFSCYKRSSCSSQLIGFSESVLV